MELTAEVKVYLDKHFDLLPTKDDITSLKDEVVLLVTEKLQKQQEKISALEEQIDKLEASNAVLESHVAHLRKSHENQEQYSRRLCLRIDGIELPPKGTNESGEKVIGKVKEIFDELEVDVPDTVIDRAHRIGPKSKDRDGKPRQQVIVRFTTWRHRTAIYRARKKATAPVKIRLDLTKPRLDLLISANDILKDYKGDYYAFADVNCRTRANIGGKFSFFDTIEELQNLIDNAGHSNS
eukprot:gene13291-14665_t